MERFTDLIRRAMEVLIALVLFGMVALTFADVIGRRLIGRPIYGAHDITEHLMALVIFAGLPLVTAVGLHLTVDLFDRYLKKRWWQGITGLLVAVIFALLAWLFFRQATTASQISEVSQALRIPRAPLYYYMSASCALSALAAAVTSVTGHMAADADNSEDAT
ncbi:MAG: TRAP transporter small permease subunit [Roseinatronobacter sp.]|nr:TRAP transporter small permease subunit [Roseinatronobacter sp.]